MIPVCVGSEIATLEKLALSIGERPRALKLSPSEVAELKAALNISSEALIREIALVGKQWSHPPISHFEVAAVGLTHNDAIYIGVNLEFPPLPLFYCVHAEQFLVARLFQEKERLKCLAVNAPPCGHCRQFLKETHGNSDLIIYTYANELSHDDAHVNDIKGLMQPLKSSAGEGPINATELAEALKRRERTKPVEYKGVQALLPLGFGPDDLLPPGPRLLDPGRQSPSEPAPNPHLGYNHSLSFETVVVESDQAAYGALEYAKRSFVPYSESPSGVSLVLSDGSVFSGGQIESAAYNPSLSSIHNALIAAYAVAGKEAWGKITRAILVEKRRATISQYSILKTLMDLLAPLASIEVKYIL